MSAELPYVMVLRPFGEHPTVHVESTYKSVQGHRAPSLAPGAWLQHQATAGAPVECCVLHTSRL